MEVHVILLKNKKVGIFHFSSFWGKVQDILNTFKSQKKKSSNLHKEGRRFHFLCLFSKSLVILITMAISYQPILLFSIYK